MRQLKKVFSLAIVGLLLLLLIPGTAKAIGHATLYDSGTPTSYDFQFTLYQNTSLDITSEDNVTFAVKCEPYDNTSVNATYTYKIYLDDGTTNNTYSVSINAKNDREIWGEMEVDPTEYIYNTSGVITLELYDGGMALLDQQIEKIGFYKSAFGSYFGDIITLMILVTVIGLVGLVAKKIKSRSR